eukprot:TRINITY_DN13670_c0_g1_i1.p2 TRINITY_DN13670_c0_g1~~TRINITY_DN13670_c0_g1_i1.p2  ORF type:complete len:103 (+),score=19.16 TRINITY_DN13670_c0_g1_i1:70-378(+)
MPRVFAVLASLSVALCIKVDPLASAIMSEMHKDMLQSEPTLSQADLEAGEELQWIGRNTPAIEAQIAAERTALDGFKAVQAQVDAENEEQLEEDEEERLSIS